MFLFIVSEYVLWAINYDNFFLSTFQNIVDSSSFCSDFIPLLGILASECLCQLAWVSVNHQVLFHCASCLSSSGTGGWVCRAALFEQTDALRSLRLTSYPALNWFLEVLDSLCRLLGAAYCILWIARIAGLIVFGLYFADPIKAS